LSTFSISVNIIPQTYTALQGSDDQFPGDKADRKIKRGASQRKMPTLLHHI
jgi:hypothetical protein